jgi:hypothetical protein
MVAAYRSSSCGVECMLCADLPKAGTLQQQWQPHMMFWRCYVGTCLTTGPVLQPGAPGVSILPLMPTFSFAPGRFSAWRCVLGTDATAPFELGTCTELASLRLCGGCNGVYMSWPLGHLEL